LAGAAVDDGEVGSEAIAVAGHAGKDVGGDSEQVALAARDEPADELTVVEESAELGQCVTASA
jgi:hypothetical protein